MSIPALAREQPLDVREVMAAVPGVVADALGKDDGARFRVYELPLQLRPGEAAQQDSTHLTVEGLEEVERRGDRRTERPAVAAQPFSS